MQPPVWLKFFRRHASQETNPIVKRLLRSAPHLEFDVNPMRTWSHQLFVPMKYKSPLLSFFKDTASDDSLQPLLHQPHPSPLISRSRKTVPYSKRSRERALFLKREPDFSQWRHLSPRVVQYQRLKKYLNGYFVDNAIIATPLVFHSMNGLRWCLVVISVCRYLPSLPPSLKFTSTSLI